MPAGSGVAQKCHRSSDNGRQVGFLRTRGKMCIRKSRSWRRRRLAAIFYHNIRNWVVVRALLVPPSVFHFPNLGPYPRVNYWYCALIPGAMASQVAELAAAPICSLLLQLHSDHLLKLLVIFRIQFCGHRRQRAEQTIGIPIDTRREEQRWPCRRTGCRTGFVSAPIIELDSPQSAYRDGRIVSVEQIPEELSGSGVKCGNRSAEAVSDQKIVAEESEVLRSQRYSPRRYQPRAVFEMLH